MTAADLAQLSHLLNPLRVQVANLAARATVQLVDDSGRMQTLQIGDIAGGPYPDCEHLQAYGFSSVPMVGADTAFVIFPNGDRNHPLVVAVADRRWRPTGGEPGEVTVYNNTGAKIVLTKDGDIVLTPAPGRKVLVRDAGTALALATKADLQALATFVQGMTLPVTGATAGPPPPASVPTPTGTTVLEAQ